MGVKKKEKKMSVFAYTACLFGFKCLAVDLFFEHARCVFVTVSSPPVIVTLSTGM